ncbi:MAG: SpoIID/LytB domain-containing protein [Clostridiales bacterium]|nr:SpoIID/LytB domain-containing protein [Clostridiales bacterium]
MRRFRLLLLLWMLLPLTACQSRAPKDFSAEPLPLASADPPTLSVHVLSADAVVSMDIETYVAGVVAGEIPNDWPMEALKAQAILARTFTVKFITEKDSRYPGADISTDITEAQAYNADAVNARIRQAVQQTQGLVLLTADGRLPYAWFHAHSGGITETAIHGLDWQGMEPTYTKVTDGEESSAAPQSVQAWQVEFTAVEFLAACRRTGADVSGCHTITIDQKGKSGRAVTLQVDGTAVNAARLRLALGSTVMRSTLLTELRVEDGTIHMAGRGYGHGVGMPQWGAYALAQRGMRGEEIALHYYSGLHLARLW